MARKNNRSKNLKSHKRTKLNVRGKKAYKAKYVSRSSPGLVDRWNEFLDRTISVRTLLKYTAIVLLFFLVVGSSFLLGRLTSSDPSPDAKLSGAPVQDLKQTEVEEDEVDDSPEPSASLDSSDEETDDVDEQEAVYRVASDDEPVEEYRFEAESPSAATQPPASENVPLTVAEFGYEYSKVGIEVSELEKLERGTNWASVESIKLTVKNGEPGTIINPTRIKIKINPKGKGSNWWDDEVFLPESFKHMKPGDEVSDTVKVHVSFSDIYSEKDFQVVVLDDYDVPIAWYKKVLTIK